MDNARTPGTLKHRSRYRLIGALSVGLMLSSFIPQPAGGAEAPGDDEFILGSGQSYAQIYRVGPTAGRLSLAPIFGLTLADYLNTVARGEAKVADWAGIGVAERSLPDNTPTLKASSNNAAAAKGMTEVVAGQSDGTSGGGFGELYVRATKAPFGEARYRFGTLTVPGLMEARDSESHTSVGVFETPKGRVRISRSTTEIQALDIGGVVSLKGLRWSTIQQTGAVKSLKGTFTMEGASIAGLPLPMASGSEGKPAIDAINAALKPTGFKMSLPAVEYRNGQANVTPLSLDIADSALGRRFLAPALAEVRPVREPVADQFIALSKQLVEMNDSIPDGSVALLAGDLALGIFAGSSQLHIEMGGVSSFTEGETFDNPFGDIDFNPPNIRPTAPETVFTPGAPGTPGTPGTPGSDPTVEGEFAAAPGVGGTRTIPGDKGGVAMAVGFVGFLVAMSLAVADWRRMRASRRMNAAL